MEEEEEEGERWGQAEDEIREKIEEEGEEVRGEEVAKDKINV